MATRHGSQTPTFEAVGEYVSSRGPEAVGLFESYGVRFMPWQARQLELYLARDGAGRAAFLRRFPFRRSLLTKRSAFRRWLDRACEVSRSPAQIAR